MTDAPARGRLIGIARRNAVRAPMQEIGAAHDTMDPKHMEMMSKAVARGRYLFCPNGSHLAMYDDQTTYFTGLTSFIRDVDSGKF